MQRKKDSKKNIFAAVRNTFKPDIIKSAPISQTIVINNSRMTLEGSFVISDFSREFIKLDFKKILVTVEGTELDLVCYGEKNAEITGDIAAIKYSKKAAEKQ